MPRIVLTFVAGALCIASFAAWGEGLNMVNRASLLGARKPFLSAPTGAGNEARHGASLFAGQAAGSFLAPFATQPGQQPRVTTLARRALPNGVGSPVERVRHLIAQAEAGPQGYDAVQLNAHRRPPKMPTQMTIQEIYLWIAQTPGQHHAIGRYQFIPATLKRLVKKRALDTNTLFSPHVQDQLADELLVEAGLLKVLDGSMTRRGFMHNLAKIWAGLPTSTGKSYYKGVAGNRATISWSQFEREMQRIFQG